MKIFLAQQNYTIGDFKGNLNKIIRAIRQAKEQEAELLVFSELCVCGYPPQDLLEFEDFIDHCEGAIDSLKAYSKELAILVGAPCRNTRREGKDLFNSAWFLYQGKVQQVVHKSCLPTYDIFDEDRYFEPAAERVIVPFKGKKLAITLCEDLWSLASGSLYPICPMEELIKQDPDLIINISASPFDYDQQEKRLAIIRTHIYKYHLPVVYCNATGVQTEMIFDGGSFILDAAGKILKAFPLFEEAIDGCTIPELQGGTNKYPAKNRSGEQKNGISLKPLHPATGNMPAYSRTLLAGLPYNPERNIDRIYQALLAGIRDYFNKLHFKEAILGLSGGIDSAVVLSLACVALGRENIHAIIMPSPFSSGHSINDAVQLSENWGNVYEIFSIDNLYEEFLRTLAPSFEGLPFDTAEENIQARIRGNLLMALANKFNYILLNTSNKSELAVGYGTLYGDMAGGISPIGDLYKTQVYALAGYINRDVKIIPEHILNKPPSAELRPDQKDSDSLPDYKILDAVLYEYIEHRKGLNDLIFKTEFEPSVVRRIVRLVHTNEYKRRQCCPALRISCKAFGGGRRIPVVARYPIGLASYNMNL